MSDSSSTQDSEHFWDVFDAFISLANEQSEQYDIGLVAAALQGAAARYSAFYAASSCLDRNELKEDKRSLIDDFSRQFKKSFADNLEEYIENYKIYLAEQQTDQD